MKHLLSFVMFFAFFTGCNKNEQEAAVKPVLKISPQEKLISNKAGTIDLYVTSNTTWKAEAKSTWLNPERTQGDGNMQIKIHYEANTTDRRSGVVRFTAEGVNPSDLIITQTELTFTNPITAIPDPWIIKHDGYYYICKAQGNGINISRSNKLSAISATKSVWKCPSDGSNKPWNIAHVWAPELHRIDGKWYIYYAAGRPHAETNSYQYQRSGVLRAKTDDPMGEWEDMGMLYTGDVYQEGIAPTAGNTNYAIDLGVFRLNGQLYAVWSGYPAGSSEQKLYIAQMSNPYTISSSRTVISSATQSWERYSATINEGPAFLKNTEKGKFFVVYSCNGSWTKQYRLGYVVLNDTLADPTKTSNWTKSASEVFYRCDDTSSRDGVNGVGHCSFTKSPDDSEDWIVYHVKNRNDNTWESGRSTFIQQFTWKADGTPDFGTPVGWGEAVALPSGESR
ncbi:MAG: family 43 glycosylhydrolase [Dysgonamonadaceae bacterium]|nr:family 43 glycosylhydrolase [Dysgonamonadaceae bacterium]